VRPLQGLGGLKPSRATAGTTSPTSPSWHAKRLLRMCGSCFWRQRQQATSAGNVGDGPPSALQLVQPVPAIGLQEGSLQNEAALGCQRSAKRLLARSISKAFKPHLVGSLRGTAGEAADAMPPSPRALPRGITEHSGRLRMVLMKRCAEASMCWNDCSVPCARWRLAGSASLPCRVRCCALPR
jgi:hypothetical protein